MNNDSDEIIRIALMGSIGLCLEEALNEIITEDYTSSQHDTTRAVAGTSLSTPQHNDPNDGEDVSKHTNSNGGNDIDVKQRLIQMDTSMSREILQKFGESFSSRFREMASSDALTSSSPLSGDAVSKSLDPTINAACTIPKEESQQQKLRLSQSLDCHNMYSTNKNNKRKKNETRTTERGEIINNTIFPNNNNSTIPNALLRGRLKYYNRVGEKWRIIVAAGAQIRPRVNLSHDRYKQSPFKHHKSLWDYSIDSSTCSKRCKGATDHINNHGGLSETSNINNNCQPSSKDSSSLFVPTITLDRDLEILSYDDKKRFSS